jgi:hypothetical protein
MDIFSSLLTRVNFALLSGADEFSVINEFSDVVLKPEVRRKVRKISRVVDFVFMLFKFYETKLTPL